MKMTAQQALEESIAIWSQVPLSFREKHDLIEPAYYENDCPLCEFAFEECRKGVSSGTAEVGRHICKFCPAPELDCYIPDSPFQVWQKGINFANSCEEGLEPEPGSEVIDSAAKITFTMIEALRLLEEKK